MPSLTIIIILLIVTILCVHARAHADFRRIRALRTRGIGLSSTPSRPP